MSELGAHGLPGWVPAGPLQQGHPDGSLLGHLTLLTNLTCLPIPVYQIGLFISYDNATKQLDMVYDVTPELAQAFLERIRGSSFDMRNISTIHRQG